MGIFNRFTSKIPIIWSFLLVGLGLYLYRIDLRENFLFGIILLLASSISMFFVLGVWRKFTENYADEIIHWTTEKQWVRKLVAGGSLSYYEYQEDVHSVGSLEPITRFLNLMIAFIGLSTTFANLFTLEPSDPLASLNSVLVWSLLIFLVPIILTPIIPVIWAMEDLKIKAWNEKHKTSWRVSRRYKARFNSIIAVSTLGAAFGLSREEGVSLLTNLSNFSILLLEGFKILTYPIAVLTLLYYLYFRGKTIEKVKSNLDLPIAETKLILFDKQGSEIQNDDKSATTMKSEPITDPISKGEEGEQHLVTKIGTGAKNAVHKTGEKIVDTGKGIASGVASVGKSINDNTIGRISQRFKSKKKKKGGSATEGLWDKEENEDEIKNKDKKRDE